MKSWEPQPPHASSPPPPRSVAEASPCSAPALYGVLVAEARLARRAIGTLTEDPPPDASGWYGRGRPGPAIRIALLGDSSAAGYGVERVEDTPGAHLASGVAAQADRRVHLREHAVVGAQSSDLASQVEQRPVHPSRPGRDPHRRQRRDPHGHPVAVRARTCPRPYAACARPASRCWWARAPTSARSSPSPRRSSRSPARGRDGWRRPRRSRSSRPAAAPSRWLGPRPRVRRRARPALRARPVPPQRGRLPRSWPAC